VEKQGNKENEICKATQRENITKLEAQKQEECGVCFYEPA